MKLIVASYSFRSDAVKARMSSGCLSSRSIQIMEMGPILTCTGHFLPKDLPNLLLRCRECTALNSFAPFGEHLHVCGLTTDNAAAVLLCPLI